MNEAISVIIPFYNGNMYVKKLIKNIVDVKKSTDANITDIIFINDSPWIQIEKTEMIIDDLDIKITVLNNERNMGIQKSRVKGLENCATPLIIFLDQDDLLISDGFNKQIVSIKNADVVVGNGFYQYGDSFEPIYKNKKVMEYLIQKKRFIEIRNLIPSPGSCLFRKESIPQEWKKTCMEVNGADDWFLWLLMFSRRMKFSINEQMVYQHNSTNAGNLSFDLNKMYQSALEMCEYLKNLGELTNLELKSLRKSIEFKYLKDTGRLKFKNIIYYIVQIVNNIVYKIRVFMA